MGRFENEVKGYSAASFYFGVPEIGVSLPTGGPTMQVGELSSLATAVERCVRIGGNRSLFDAHDDRVADGFDAAYGVFMQSKDDRQALVDLCKHPAMAGRERLPSVKKPALLACYLTFKPATQDQRNICSEYANVIECALDKSISINEFSTWFADAAVTVATCKKHMRKVRAAKRAVGSDDVDAQSGGDLGALQIRVRGKRRSTEWLTVPAVPTAIEALLDIKFRDAAVPAGVRMAALALALSSAAEFLFGLARIQLEHEQTAASEGPDDLESIPKSMKVKFAAPESTALIIDDS